MKKVNYDNLENKNGAYKTINILDNELMAIKSEKEFKKKYKKYLAARHETDQYIRVTRPGNKKPVLDGKPK